MTAALSDIPPPGGWTTEDLDALPPDNRRRELLDGALIMSPSPTRLHRSVAARLMIALEESCPDDYDVTQAVEVRISNKRSFIPDVLVTDAAAAARNPAHYLPQEVLLVVEIVSEGSQSMDRVLKPALYADAGIPYFWRIEITPKIVVHTYKIDLTTGVYGETGAFDDDVLVGEPWGIEIQRHRLTPRHSHRG